MVEYAQILPSYFVQNNFYKYAFSEDVLKSLLFF